jgi:hypothetical protein
MNEVFCGLAATMKTPQSKQANKGSKGSKSDKKSVKHKKDDKKGPKSYPEKTQEGTQTSSDLFKEAIFALGGDEDDFEMLQNISDVDEQKSKKAADDVSTLN